MVLAYSFLPRGVSLWTLSLWYTIQDEQIPSPACAPGALQITVSMLYVCGLFAWLLHKRCSSTFWALQELSTLTFKIPGFKPCWLAKAMKLLFAFQVNYCGDSFSPCTPLCVSLSLALLSNCGSLPNIAATIQSISLPNPVTALRSFLVVASSLPLVVGFVLPVFRSISGIFRMIWW